MTPLASESTNSLPPVGGNHSFHRFEVQAPAGHLGRAPVGVLDRPEPGALSFCPVSRD